MPQEKEGGFEYKQRFEREVVEPTKRAMEEAMSEATSEKNAKQRIKEALPKGRSFLGPLVMYMEHDMGEGERQRSIRAMVGTLDDQNNHVNIEAEFIG